MSFFFLFKNLPPLSLNAKTMKLLFFSLGLLGVTQANSYFCAAVVAIVIVHIILGCFIYVAFTEDDTPRPEFKQELKQD